MSTRTDMTYDIPQMNKPLKIWDKIEIVIGGGEQAAVYLTRVEDFVAGGIVVADPERTKGKPQVMENVIVLVLVQGDDAVYQFRSKMKRFASENSRRYILSPPTAVKRVQRRQFVRINYTDKIQYALVPQDDVESFEYDQVEWQQSMSLNLSGGGLCMEIIEGIDLGDPLLLKVSCFGALGLPDAIIGVVRRLEFNQGATRAGIEFILRSDLRRHLSMEVIRKLPMSIQNFDDSAQNELINFIFREQIELRNKGLL